MKVNKSNKTSKNSKKPIGITILMIWQVLIILYCVEGLVTYFHAVSFGGTVFGISEPNNFKIFLVIVIFVNVTSLIGTYKRKDLGRWIYVVSLIILLALKFLQFLFFMSYHSIFFFKGDIVPFELLLLIIDFVILCYLLINRNVRTYFCVDRSRKS